MEEAVRRKVVEAQKVRAELAERVNESKGLNEQLDSVRQTSKEQQRNLEGHLEKVGAARGGGRGQRFTCVNLRMYFYRYSLFVSSKLFTYAYLFIYVRLLLFRFFNLLSINFFLREEL